MGAADDDAGDGGNEPLIEEVHDGTTEPMEGIYARILLSKMFATYFTICIHPCQCMQAVRIFVATCSPCLCASSLRPDAVSRRGEHNRAQWRGHQGGEAGPKSQRRGVHSESFRGCATPGCTWKHGSMCSRNNADRGAVLLQWVIHNFSALLPNQQEKMHSEEFMVGDFPWCDAV